MNQPTSELQKLLQQLDQQIAQASDESTRQELQRLRARLDSPEMLNMARELAGSRPSDPASLVLEFHDPLLPNAVTAAACVIAAATCLFAIVEGFKNAHTSMAGNEINLWLVAVFAGACTAMFTALSFMRTFSVRVDTEGMASRSMRCALEAPARRCHAVEGHPLVARSQCRIACWKCAPPAARLSRFRCGW